MDINIALYVLHLRIMTCVDEWTQFCEIIIPQSLLLYDVERRHPPHLTAYWRRLLSLLAIKASINKVLFSAIEFYNS